MKYMIMMWALTNPEFPGPAISVLEYDNIKFDSIAECDSAKYFIIGSDPNPSVALMCVPANEVVR